MKAPGASGSLTIGIRGDQVFFDGRIDLAKGPAKGFILVTATNLQMDENGKPNEGGSVGPLQIWGKGQASIAFGKVLTGTAAIEYTKDGRIIITGEIALPPRVDLFDRVSYSKRLLEVEEELAKDEAEALTRGGRHRVEVARPACAHIIEVLRGVDGEEVPGPVVRGQVGDPSPRHDGEHQQRREKPPQRPASRSAAERTLRAFDTRFHPGPLRPKSSWDRGFSERSRPWLPIDGGFRRAQRPIPRRDRPP